MNNPYLVISKVPDIEINRLKAEIRAKVAKLYAVSNEPFLDPITEEHVPKSAKMILDEIVGLTVILEGLTNTPLVDINPLMTVPVVNNDGSIARVPIETLIANERPPSSIYLSANYISATAVVGDVIGILGSNGIPMPNYSIVEINNFESFIIEGFYLKLGQVVPLNGQSLSVTIQAENIHGTAPYQQTFTIDVADSHSYLNIYYNGAQLFYDNQPLLLDESEEEQIPRAILYDGVQITYDNKPLLI